MNATSGQQASKPLTPAQTAKPYGTAAKNAALPGTKKAESHATEQASDIANDDAVKAIEKLETRTKAVYVTISLTLSLSRKRHVSNTIPFSNANSIARVANSQMTDPEDKLQPLLSLKTGKPIEKFPLTPASISKLGRALSRKGSVCTLVYDMLTCSSSDANRHSTQHFGG